MLFNLLIAADAAPETSNTGMMHALISEWYIILPLLLLSIAGLGIFLERWWSLKKIGESYPAFHDDIVGMVNEGKFEQAVAAAEGNFPGELYGAILRGRGRSLAGLLPVIERKMATEAERLKRMVWILGSLGTLAPFIGLLGTVIGIIFCFQDMAAKGGGGIAVVGAGISAALYATAMGLGVGIAAVAGFNILNVMLGHLNNQLRNNAEELAEVVVIQSAKMAPKRPTATGV
jgi:biopolymer transport protein ExbB/TolQ